MCFIVLLYFVKLKPPFCATAIRNDEEEGEVLLEDSEDEGQEDPVAKILHNGEVFTLTDPTELCGRQTAKKAQGSHLRTF